MALPQVIKYIKNWTKTRNVLPITIERAIYDDDGNRLDNKLSNLENKGLYIDEYEEEEPFETNIQAIDADTLGGHEPEYFATKTDLDEKGSYSKPDGGIPKTDLTSAVQESLDKADSALQTLPTSLPANGGNADTVNGYTVNADVPSGAKFTDTTNINSMGGSPYFRTVGKGTYTATGSVAMWIFTFHNSAYGGIWYLRGNASALNVETVKAGYDQTVTVNGNKVTFASGHTPVWVCMCTSSSGIC